MKKLDESYIKCLVVVDEKEKLLGTITDGDIRRGILNGLNSSNSIKGVFNLNPVKVNQKLFTEKKALNIIKKHNIELVPIVNNDNVVKNIFINLLIKTKIIKN